MYDHFHATITVYTGKLAGQQLEVEGGLSKPVSYEEYSAMYNEWPKAKLEQWLKDTAGDWLPEGISYKDLYEIESFRLAG